MPAKTSVEARAAILALHGIGLTSRRIVDALKKQNYVISKSTVTSVIRELKNANAGHIKPPRKMPPQNLPHVRTKELIGKVKKELGKSTPLSKRQMAKKYDVSVNTINRIIKIDLKGEIVSSSSEKKVSNSNSNSNREDKDKDKDTDGEAEATEKAERKAKKKRSRSSRSEDDSSRKSKSSKKRSLKTKIPKVRRRKDSSEREPETELLEPYREISEDS